MADVPAGLIHSSTDGPVLKCRITPKSSRNQIDGYHRDGEGHVSLQVRVTAHPEKGKANKAVIQTLAKGLKLPKSAIEIVSGGTARRKSVLIRTRDAELVQAIKRLQVHI